MQSYEIGSATDITTLLGDVDDPQEDDSPQQILSKQQQPQEVLIYVSNE